ncbi:MAG: TonB-dependent receptor [Gammaproteobacteria bacterium]|nr:TonB-dependent receptor [Gammaproteobacteria bacterium]
MSPETGLNRDPVMQDELDTCTGGAFPGSLQMKYFPFGAILALYAGIAAIPFSAYGDGQDEYPLTIVVTSSRAAETVDETMTPVTVIDRQQIEQSGDQTIVEALARVPGLVFSSRGGRGTSSGIFLRGTSSRHVLVMVDGVQIGSATLGQASLDDIPLSIVEKIEVVRGPRSSLYGSEAIGGVIQIFTRQAKKGFTPSLSTSAGSHDTYEVDVGFSSNSGNNWYSVFASAVETDGINACNGNRSCSNTSDFPDTGYDPDRDGHQNRSVNLKGGIRLSEGFDLSSGLTLSSNNTEFDGSLQDERDSEVRVLFVRGDWSIDDDLTSNLTLSESVDYQDNFFKGEFYSRFNTTRKQVSWLNQWDSEVHRVVAGIDYNQDEVESTNDYAETERDNIGYFASLRSSLTPVDIETSVRLDDNESYGEKMTGAVAFGKDISPDWRLMASYGTAFKAPTFNDLYWPGSENPDLKPEESSSAGLDAIYSNEGNRLSFHLYQTDIENLIAWAPTPEGPWKPSNVDEAKITGLEIAFQTSIDTLGFVGSLTFQEALNKGDNYQDKLLIRRPKSLAFFEITQNFDLWKVGISWKYRGKTYDDPGNNNQIDAYSLVGFRLARKLGEDWNIDFKIDNVFDDDYETALGYNQDNRNYMLTLRYTPR